MLSVVLYKGLLYIPTSCTFKVFLLNDIHYLPPSILKPMVGCSSVVSSSYSVNAPAISAGSRAAGIPIGLGDGGGASNAATFFSKSSDTETVIVKLLSDMINSFCVVDVSNVICCE